MATAELITRTEKGISTTTYTIEQPGARQSVQHFIKTMESMYPDQIGNVEMIGDENWEGVKITLSASQANK